MNNDHKNPWCIESEVESESSLTNQKSFEDNFEPTKTDKLPDSKEYLETLEKKLNKLKTKSGVLKQLSERREECLENLLRGSIDITSESDLDFCDNSRTAAIVRHINPEQAINSAELLHIIKHDQLATETDIENVDQSKETESEK